MRKNGEKWEKREKIEKMRKKRKANWKTNVAKRAEYFKAQRIYSFAI